MSFGVWNRSDMELSRTSDSATAGGCRRVTVTEPYKECSSLFRVELLSLWAISIFGMHATVSCVYPLGPLRLARLPVGDTL